MAGSCLPYSWKLSRLDYVSLCKHWFCNLNKLSFTSGLISTWKVMSMKWTWFVLLSPGSVRLIPQGMAFSTLYSGYKVTARTWGGGGGWNSNCSSAPNPHLWCSVAIRTQEKGDSLHTSVGACSSQEEILSQMESLVFFLAQILIFVQFKDSPLLYQNIRKPQKVSLNTQNLPDGQMLDIKVGKPQLQWPA